MSCDLNLGEDQRQILDACETMLRDNFPVARLRDQGPEPLELISEFGGLSLALPEELGGAGFSQVEEALIHVQFGRHLVSTRVIAASIGARLAAANGDDDLARKIGAGQTQICAGIENDDQLLLIENQGANLALIWGPQRLRLVDITEVSPQISAAMGNGQPLATSAFRSQSVMGESAGDWLVQYADLLVSAHLLGIAEASLELAVSYACLREQFGRPIGSFQAIKHKCADMAIGAEMLSAQLHLAAIYARDGRSGVNFQIAALRRIAPKIAFNNTRQTIQIHGGIGFSAEADAHHFLKRVHVLNQMGGHADLLALSAPLMPKKGT